MSIESVQRQAKKALLAAAEDPDLILEGYRNTESPCLSWTIRIAEALGATVTIAIEFPQTAEQDSPGLLQ